MVQLEYSSACSEIIISLGRKVLFLDASSNIQKQIILPDNLKELIPIAPLSEEEKLSKQENPIQDITPTIQHMKISPNGKLLALTTNGHKSLILYQLSKLKACILSIRGISRVSSAINFSADSTKILICDKTGDCYIFDSSENIEKPGKWILGHLSIVYDVKFSDDEKFVITCDRDEKIRTTHFPNCHEIESYCLGHDEYVAGIEILTNHPKLLLSVSGDKKIKLWKWNDGIELAEMILPAPAVRFCVKPLTANIYEIVVLIYQPNQSIFAYELEITDSGQYNFKIKCSRNFDSAIVTNICYIDSGLLASIFDDRRLRVECFDVNGKLDLISSKNLKDSIENGFKDEEFCEPEDICGWFKKKFDNVSDYLDRKKRRIDDKYMNK